MQDAKSLESSISILLHVHDNSLTLRFFVWIARQFPTMDRTPRLSILYSIPLSRERIVFVENGSFVSVVRRV